MDDVLRRLTAGGCGLILMTILFLLTAIECSILDCSENKLKQLCDEKGDRRAKHVLSLKDKRQAVKVTGIVIKCLLTALICFFAVWGFYGALRAAFSDIAGRVSGIAAYAVLTVIVFTVVPVMINTPKRLSGYEIIGEKLALRGCGVFSVLMVLLRPVTALADGLGNMILKRCGIKDTSGDEPVSEEDILLLVDAVNDSGDIDENQAEMITNIFEFDDLEAKDVMTHRIDITGIERSSPLSEAAELAINEGFSRIPVYDGTIDSICGVIFSKDLLRICYEQKLDDLTAGDVCRDISFVPESIK